MSRRQPAARPTRTRHFIRPNAETYESSESEDFSDEAEEDADDSRSLKVEIADEQSVDHESADDTNIQPPPQVEAPLQRHPQDKEIKTRSGENKHQPTQTSEKKDFYKGSRAEEIATTEAQPSSDESEEESEGSEESSESESEEERPRKLKFVSKIQGTKQKENDNDTKRHDETLRRIQQHVRYEEAAKVDRFASKTDEDIMAIDDTDDLDPAAEYAAWKIRELKRLQRERQKLEEREKEYEELERRRGLTEEQLAKEDADRLADQEDKKANGPKAAFMQKYYHKGAFYSGAAGDLENRDVLSSRNEDDYVDKRLLPEVLQVRGGLGLKGRSKYKSLKDEDTSRPAKKPRT